QKLILWWREWKRQRQCLFNSPITGHRPHTVKKMTINEIQDERIDDFAFFDDWMAKYEYLIQLGKDLPVIDGQYQKDDYLINGCQSKVWLPADYNGDKVSFTADSDAFITKGLVALMIKVLSGHTPDEIADSELYFIDR